MTDAGAAAEANADGATNKPDDADAEGTLESLRPSAAACAGSTR